jgi:hypothetical protein
MVAGREDEEAEVEVDVYCAMTDGANSYKLKAYPPPQIVDFDASPAHKVVHLVEVMLYTKKLPVKHSRPFSMPKNRYWPVWAKAAHLAIVMVPEYDMDALSARVDLSAMQPRAE